MISSQKTLSYCLLSIVCVGLGTLHAANYTNTVANGGTITAGDSAIVMNPMTSITGDILNNGSLQFWQSGTLTDTNVISGSGYLYQSGTGTTILGSANTYTAGTSINAGVLSVSSIADGTASSIGAGSGGTGWVGLYGGTLSYTGLGSQTTTRALWIDAVNSGTGGGTFDIANAGASLTWNPSSGNIIYGVTKTGAGTFTLGGVMSGSSPLTVNGGTMNLRAANTSTGAVTVNSGTLNVTGSGQLFSSINGPKANAVTVQNGGELQIGNWDWTGSFGTLNYEANALNLNGGTLTYLGTTANGYAGRGFTVGANGATFNAASVGQTWVLARSSYAPYQSVFNGSATLTGVGNGQMDQIITGAGSLTKNGSGAWTLTAGNTFSGGTVVNAGTLILSNTSTTAYSGIGDIRGNLTINQGASVRALSASNGWALGWVGATNAVSSIAVNGGTLSFSNTSYYDAGTVATNITLNGGTINNLGSNNGYYGSNHFGWYFAQTSSPTLTVLSNPVSSVIGTGINIRLNGSNNNVVFNVASGATNGTDLLVTGPIFNAGSGDGLGGIVKAGTGTMRVNGNASYTGGTTINAGSLNFNGTNTFAGGNIRVGGAGGASTLTFAGGPSTAASTAYLYAGTASGDRAVVNVATNLSIGNVNLGASSGASGALNISGGTFSQSGGPAWWAFMVGATNGGYGSVRMTGGALNVSELGIGGAAGGNGSFDLLGGTMTVSNWFTLNRADASFPGNIAAMNISGGTLNASTAGNGLGWGGGGYGVINVGSGGTANFGTNALRLAYNGGNNPTNIVTLGTGGVLQSGGVTMNGSAAGGSAILNFNGGTLKAGTANSSFLQGLTGVYVSSGGGIIDNNGNNITIAQNLLAPTGSGLASITLSNGGSGYIGAPVVQISGGGGTGATAIAQIDTNTGSITNILVTSAGSGYTSAPTVTLVGGGAATAASGISVATNAVSSGGLTFSGSSATVLSGNNTFGGGITVNGGVLQFTSDAQLGNATNGISLNGGQLYNNQSTPTIAASRTITLGSNGGYLMSGWGSNSTYLSPITGSGSLGIAWDSGTVTLAGSNSYTGTTTIGTTNAPYWWNNVGANPTLKLANSNALTGGGALVFGTSPSTNTAMLNLNGYNASVGGLTGTNNAVLTNSTGTLSTLTLGVTTNAVFGGKIAGNIALIKNGSGTETLSGQNTYSAGTVINGGTLSFTTNNALLNNASNGITINNGGVASFGAWNVIAVSGAAVSNVITVNAGGTLLNSGNSYNMLGALNLNGGTINSAGTNTLNGIGFELGGPVTVNGGTNTSVIAGSGIGLSSATNLTTVFNVANGATASGVDLLVSGKLVNGSTTNWPTNVVSSLTKTGNGVMMLSNNNTYSGATLVSGGTLQMGVNNAISTNSVVTLTNGGTLDLNGTAQSIQGIQINGSSMTQTNGSITTVAGGDGVFAIGSAPGTVSSYTLGGGTVTLANAGNLQVGQYGNGTFTQTGGAVNSGSWTVIGRYAGSTGVYNISGGSLTETNLSTRLIVGESGSGTMTVSGSASVTALGGVSLAWGGGSGVLNLNGGTLTTPSIVGAAYGGSGTQTLNLNGGTIVATASTNNFIGGLTAAHILSNGVTVNDSGYALTIGQSFDGAGAFTKSGAGTVTLSSGNTYAGGTIVSRGSLKGNTSSSFGTGTIVLGDASTGTNAISLVMDTSSGTTNQNAILVSSNAGGSVAIGGTNTGNTVPNVWAGQMTLNTNVQLFANNTTTRSTFAGQITGNGGIMVTQGRVTLDNSSNSYAGATVVNAGSILQLNANEVIPNASALTVNGTVYFASGGGTETVSALDGWGTVQAHPGVPGSYMLNVSGSNNTIFSGTIANGGGTLSVVKDGTGTQTLGGVNTHTGGTTVNAGTLVLSDSQANGNGVIRGSLTVNSNATVILTNNTAALGWNTGANVTNLVINQGSVIGSITQHLYVQAGQPAGTVTLNGGLLQENGGVSSATAANWFEWGNFNVNVLSNASSSVISGMVRIRTDSSPNLAFTVASGATNGTDLLVSAALTEVNGAGNISKAGAGRMMLSGSNTYTGTTTVSGGGMQAGSSKAFGVNSAVTLSNVAGVVLDLNGFNNSIGSLAGGGSNGGNVTLGSGTLTAGGNNSSTTFAGLISGTGGFVKTGGGDMILSGSNSYTGLTTVSQGFLMLSNATGPALYNGGSGTVSMNNTAGSTYYGLRFGSANQLGSNVALSFDGNGTWNYVQLLGNNQAIGSIIGTNSAYGVIENTESQSGIGNSTLTVNQTTNGTFAGYMRNTANGSGTLSLVKNGAATLTLAGNNITYTGPTTVSAGTLLVSGLLGGGNYSGAITDNASLVFSNTSTQTLGGAISGSGSFTQAGTGVTILSVSNGYSGGTVVSRGTLKGSTSSSFGTGTIVMGDASTGTNNIALVIDTASGTTNQNALLVSGNGTGNVAIGGTNTGATVPNVWAGQLTLNTNVQLFAGDTNTRTTFTGRITGNGGITVTQGRVTIDNASNNYAGTTVVNSGSILQLNSSEVIPNASALTVNGSLYLASGGGTESVSSLSGTGTIQAHPAVPGAYTLGVLGSSNATFGGTIANGSGTLSFVKEGAGTQTLAGVNTYTGGTTVNNGTLVLSDSQGNGYGVIRGSLTVNSNASVILTNYQTALGWRTGANVTNLVINQGSVIGYGWQHLWIEAAQPSGSVTLNGGVMQENGGVSSAASTNYFEWGNFNVNVLSNTASSVISGRVNLRADAFSNLQVTVAQGATNGVDLLYSAAITQSGGAVGITKSGTGLMLLSGTNTYSGATTVAGGILRAGSSQAFGTNSVVTLSNTAGVTLDLNGYNETIDSLSGGGTNGGNVTMGTGTLTLGNANGSGTYAGVISGTGGLVKNGSGNETLAGNNTFSGKTVINNGFLVLSNTAGPALYNGGTGTLSMNITGNGIYGLQFGAANQLGSNVTLSFDGGGTWNYVQLLGNNQTIGSIIGTNSAYGVIENTESQSGIGSSTLTVNQTTNGTFAGYMRNNNAGSGTLSLVKNGAATLTLSGNNITYTGGTIVNAGALVLKGGGFDAGIVRGAATVNNGGNLVLDYSSGAYPVASTDTLNVNGGGTLTLSGGGGGSSISNSYVGTVALNSSNGTSAVVISPDSTGLRFGRATASVLSSAGSATNTYAAGMILVSGGSAPSVSVASNNTLNVSGSITDLSGYGGVTLTKNGAGTLIYSGSNSYSGATVISAGTLQVGNGGTNGTLGTGSITDNATLAFNRSDSYLVSNQIGGSGVIIQNGTGTTILTGANNNSGNTVINAGTLQVGNGGTAGTLGSGNITNNASLVYNLSSAAGSSYTVGSGSVTQAGTGTFTVYQTNTYTGGTYITRGGTIAIASTGGLTGTTNINLGTTNSRGTLDLSAKGASGYTFGSNQTLSGNGTITTGATNRTVTVNGALTPGNSIGTLAVNGNLTLGSTAQSIFELGTAGTLVAPGLSDRTTVTGNLSLGGSLSLLDNAGANGQGTMGPGVYRLFTYGGSLSGNFTNTPPSLIYNNTLYRPSLVTATLGVVDLDIAQLAAGSFFTNAISLAYHVTNSGSVTATLGISNSVAAGGGSLGVSLASNSGSASVAGAGFSNLTPTSSTNISISVAKTNLGVTMGTAIFAMNDTGVGGGSAPLSLGSNAITYTATGYNLATATIASTNLNLGRIHAGGIFATTNLSLSNNAPNSAYTETLGATFGNATGGASGSGSVTGLAAGSSDTSLSVTLTNTTAGAKSGTIAVALNSQEVGNSGLGNTALSAQTVNVTGFVYTGQGVWNTNGGSWSDFGNWQQAGGVAGIDGALSANDTATFGTGGSGSVTLDGTAPSLQSITFSNSTSSYEIAQGSGGGLTLQSGNTNASLNVQAGSHSITASVNAASDITLNTASNSQLTLSGSVSGVGGLNQTGSGTTILSASNSYTGLTKVSTGTLAVNGSIAGDLQVDAGATLKGSGTVAGDATIAGTHSVGNSPGLQSFGSSLSYKSTSTVLLEFTQNNPGGRGVSFDAIDVAGDLSFDPGAMMSLTFNSVGSSVNWNDLLWNDYVKTSDGWLLYRVNGTLSGLGNVTISGTFLDSNGVALGTVRPDAYFNLFQVGSDVYLNYAIPEPSTYVLFGLGAFVLVFFARYRARKS